MVLVLSINNEPSLTYLPTYLPNYLPTCLATYQPTYLSTYPLTHLSTYSPTHPPIHLFTYPANHLSTYLPSYLPTHSPTYLTTHSPVDLSTNLDRSCHLSIASLKNTRDNRASSISSWWFAFAKNFIQLLTLFVRFVFYFSYFQCQFFYFFQSLVE